MNANRDRLVQEWLDEGPKGATDRLVLATLGAVHETPQRRPLLPRLLGPRPMRRWQALTAAAVGVLIAATLVVPPLTQRLGTGQPSPSASPSGEWLRFESPRHGYTALYPPGWNLTPSQTRWVVTSGRMEEAADILEGPSGTRILVASQPKGYTQSGSAWVQSYYERLRAAVGDECTGGPPVSWTGVIVGQRRGLLSTRCPESVLEVVAYAGEPLRSRGYVIRFVPAPGVDRGLFDTFLAGIEFHPTAGDDG